MAFNMTNVQTETDLVLFGKKRQRLFVDQGEEVDIKPSVFQFQHLEDVQTRTLSSVVGLKAYTLQQ